MRQLGREPDRGLQRTILAPSTTVRAQSQKVPVACGNIYPALWGEKDLLDVLCKRSSRQSRLCVQEFPQITKFRQFAAARGWTIVAEYRDEGICGAKDSRPELNRLMIAARRRQFDVVLCWKLDRFGRSLRHLVNALAELEAVGVAFVSLTDNLDLSTPAGRLMFQVIAAMGEFERELIRERVRAGLRHARARGRRLGRPKVVADGHQVATLRRAGRSLREICRQTGLSKGTAQRAYCAQKSVPGLPKNHCGPISSSV